MPLSETEEFPIRNWGIFLPMLGISYLQNTTNYSFQSTQTELRKILSAVRNRILEWSILLEENGIIGEGLRFNDAELKIAKESQIINNYTNNFFSSADDAKIQQGGKGNEQQ